MSLRSILHIVVAALSWLLFGFYWWLVSRRQLSESTVDALQLLLVVVLTIWLLTALWVWHNVRLFRGREDRRSRRPPTELSLELDYLGRKVEVVGSAPVQFAPYVYIRFEGEGEEMCKYLHGSLAPGEIAPSSGGESA